MPPNAGAETPDTPVISLGQLSCAGSSTAFPDPAARIIAGAQRGQHNEIIERVLDMPRPVVRLSLAFLTELDEHLHPAQAEGEPSAADFPSSSCRQSSNA